MMKKKVNDLEYVHPYPEDKLEEEYNFIIDKLFETDVAMKLICMKHKHLTRPGIVTGCVECPLHTYDHRCLHNGLKGLVTGAGRHYRIEKEIEEREEAWADEHGLTGDE